MMPTCCSGPFPAVLASCSLPEPVPSPSDRTGMRTLPGPGLGPPVRGRGQRLRSGPAGHPGSRQSRRRPRIANLAAAGVVGALGAGAADAAHRRGLSRARIRPLLPNVPGWCSMPPRPGIRWHRGWCRVARPSWHRRRARSSRRSISEDAVPMVLAGQLAGRA